MRIDWSNNESLIIIAEITYFNNATAIVFNFTNAVNVQSNYAFNANKTSAVVTIIYIPARNEFPIFTIVANDNANLSSSATLTGIRICDCNSLDQSNTCNYDNPQYVINPSVSKVSCSCEKYYTGKNLLLLA